MKYTNLWKKLYDISFLSAEQFKQGIFIRVVKALGYFCNSFGILPSSAQVQALARLSWFYPQLLQPERPADRQTDHLDKYF